MMVLSLVRAPLFSAASIMDRAMRSLTDPPGLKDSILAQTATFLLGFKSIQSNQRGMADEFRNIGIGVFHGLLPSKAGRLSPFGTIDFFEKGNLLGLG